MSQVSRDLQHYSKEWEVDSKIDLENLHLESMKIPVLHSKYINFIANERLIHKKLLRKRKSLFQTLTDYYSGKIDGKDIGRDPFPLSETKSGIEKRVESDPDLDKIDAAIELQEEKILFLKEVVSNINQRNFQLKLALDFQKFKNGL